MDGIKLSAVIEDATAYLEASKLNHYYEIDTNGCLNDETLNGATKRLYRSIYKKYKILLNVISYPDGKNKGYINIYGSLYKSYFGGANYQDYNYSIMKTEIEELTTHLQIPASQLKIDRIEIGLNLKFWEKPIEWLENSLILYKDKEFSRYEKDRKSKKEIGYYCTLSQSQIKIYDKSYQYDLDNYLLRYEVKITKMQKLREYGIFTLDDLLCNAKMNNLMQLLSQSWGNVLINDNANSSKLSPKEQSLIEAGSNPKYWLRVKNTRNYRVYKYQRDRFVMLNKKYGLKAHDKLKKLLEEEWLSFMEN